MPRITRGKAEEVKLTPIVRSKLEKAGWVEGRKSSPPVALPSSLTFTREALEIIEQFGGLTAGEWGPGEECGTSDITIDPSLAIGMEDTIQKLGLRYHRTFSPLGETDHGYCLLLIDDHGALYIYGEMDLIQVGDNFYEGLDALFRGLKGKPCAR